MNVRAMGYTAHACDISGLYECRGDGFGGGGVCDQVGCGFNPYALGVRDYYVYRRNEGMLIRRGRLGLWRGLSLMMGLRVAR